ncbi:MAG: hypothetical protein KGZ86_06135 [Candidatus Latescibacteria bacterium]|nr:hypothetical protein [Candidatus Latescibacterota bacterium]
MSISNKHSLEELREVIKNFRNDLEWLYRYGNAGNSSNFFLSLNEEDKKRLICLALLEKDKDTLIVTRYFMEKMNLADKSIDDLLMLMAEESRLEIEMFIKSMNEIQYKDEIPNDEYQRIINELKKAVRKIGGQPIEHAFWILIPKDINCEALWIDASDSSSVFSTEYAPEKHEKYEFISNARRSIWIIHVHNHPAVDFIGGDNNRSLMPSKADHDFARQWKGLYPELQYKLLFLL